MLEWLEPISAELSQLASSFAQTPQASTMTAQQLVALRRINWLVPRLQDRLDALIKEDCEIDPPSLADQIISQCKEALSNLPWVSWGDIFTLLDRSPDIADSKNFHQHPP